MNDVPHNVVNSVARLMCEMEPMANTSGIAGGAMAQDASSLMTINQLPGGAESKYEDNGDCQEYSEEELQLAKQFIELVGDAERARELVDKALDCEECLGMIDDEENIEFLASIMPDTPDMPTSGGMAIQFDPNQGM